MNPNATVCKIENQVILATSPIQWSLRTGGQPVESLFDITPVSASVFAGGNNLAAQLSSTAVNLSIKVGPTEFLFKYLYVQDLPPGANPKLSRVRVQDRRCWWRFQPVVRQYNIRRNVGTKALTAQENALWATTPVNPDAHYARWSLKGGQRRWLVTEMLSDVLSSVTQPEKGKFGVSPKIRYFAKGLEVTADSFDRDYSRVSPENVIIDMPGDQAVDMLLAQMPDVGLYVNPDGDVIIYKKTDKSELKIVKAMGEEAEGMGHIEVVSNQRRRPESIDVRFDYRAELRFDYHEPPSYDAESDYSDTRFLENVLPLPDMKLVVNGVQQVSGSWVPFPDYLQAAGKPPGWTRTIDFPDLRQAMLPGLDFYAALQAADAGQTTVDWVARAAAIQQHFRRTFRIPKFWLDRIGKWWAVRIAVLDPVEGTPAKSMPYCDWTAVLGQKGIAAYTKKDLTRPYLTVDGYPVGDITANTKAAPADVVVLDQDQGVFQITMKSDPIRGAQRVFPGRMHTNYTVSYDIRKAAFETPATNAVSALNKNAKPRLADAFDLAIIITATPAPTNEKTLFVVNVTPQQAGKAYVAAEGLGNGDEKAFGPKMGIRVKPAVEVARVGWKDNRARDIEALFGVRSQAVEVGIAAAVGAVAGGAGMTESLALEATAAILTDQATAPNLKDLVMNSDPAGGKGQVPNTATVERVALAYAAREYASMVDRPQGNKAGLMAKGNAPGGFIDEVSFVVNTNGSAFNTINIAGDLPQLNLMSLMDSNTRNIVYKLARDWI